MGVTTVSFNKGHYHLVKEMEEWCHRHLGIGGWVYADPDDWHARDWGISISFGNTVFYFKNEANATAFALRWK